MKLILMGTGPFAVPSFEALRQDGHEILSVVTRPEAPTTSKKGAPPSPVRLWAEEHGLPRYSPSSINAEESVKWLRESYADLFVVCDYGQILSSECLKASRLGGINLHGSLLPRHRGAAPVQWSILSGDKRAGVSVIHMTAGLDAGPILGQDATDIEDHESAADLETRLSELGVSTVRRSLKLLESGIASQSAIEQNVALATKAPRLNKLDGQLDVQSPVRLIDRQCRGLNPWPGCYGELELPNGTRIRVIFHSGFPVVCSLSNFQLGDIIMGSELRECLPHERQSDSHLGIVVRDGVYCVQQIQPAGKRVMSSEEFARGYQRNGRLRVAPIAESPKLLQRMLKMEST